MAHKGIREWTGDEAANLIIGQGGFDVISTETAASSKGINYWVAFKATSSSTEVVAESYGAGDHFSTTGASNGAALPIALGDIVYGAFSKINPSSGSVIAYKGK
jgi:hypothetical protein